MEYQEIIRFHGHECPGLAIGYRMSKAALEALESRRSKDEEVVAIVENDACGTDALQCVTGCTFGKGNFIFKDHGKQAYTLFSRSTGQGVRVVFNGGAIPKEIRKDRKALIKYLLKAPDSEILTLKDVDIKEPSVAQVHGSITCAMCGEAVMKTRIREVNGRQLCIPCAEEVERSE